LEDLQLAKAIDDKIKKVIKKNVGFDQLFKWTKKSMDGLPADTNSGDILFFLSLHQQVL